MGTKYLAKITQTFVFFNLGTVLAVIIALLVKTDVKNTVSLFCLDSYLRLLIITPVSSRCNQASYTFTKNINGSGWNSQGLTFLLGLLSVVSIPSFLLHSADRDDPETDPFHSIFSNGL